MRMTVLKRVAMGVFIGLSATITPGMAQSSVSYAAGITENESSIHKQMDFIDKDGNAGVLSSINRDSETLLFTFTCNTEIGETVETYTVRDNVLTEVEISKIDYNRPKFWNESVAKANDDDEWYDPEKSTSDQSTFLFMDGQLASWKGQHGTVVYVLNKEADRRAKEIKKRYQTFIKALDQ